MQPLRHAGAPAALGAGTMLPGTEAGGIDLVRLGVDPLTTGRRRHAAPQEAQTLLAAVTDDEGQYLPRQSRDGHPEGAVAPPPARAHPHLVELQRVAWEWREELVTQPEGCGLFVSVRRMVSRLTLSARATARGESRSRRRLAICSAFSGVTRRSFGTGVKLLQRACTRAAACPSGSSRSAPPALLLDSGGIDRRESPCLEATASMLRSPIPAS
jgi:hypothetical protein